MGLLCGAPRSPRAPAELARQRRRAPCPRAGLGREPEGDSRCLLARHGLRFKPPWATAHKLHSARSRLSNMKFSTTCRHFTGEVEFSTQRVSNHDELPRQEEVPEREKHQLPRRVLSDTRLRRLVT